MHAEALIKASLERVLKEGTLDETRGPMSRSRALPYSPIAQRG